MGLGEKAQVSLGLSVLAEGENLSETSEAIHVSLRDTAAVPKGVHGLKMGTS